MTWPVALKSSDRTMEKRVELLLWLVVTEPKAPSTVNIAWIFSTANQAIIRAPLQLWRRCPPCLSSACSSWGLSQHWGTVQAWAQHRTPGVH